MTAGTPEARLWNAVIKMALDDALVAILAIQRTMMRNGGVSLYGDEYELTKVYHDINSDWFIMLCDWVEIHHSHILRVLKNWEIRAGIHERVKG